MSSLRELYVDPSNAWSFVPSAPGSSQQPPAIKRPQSVYRFAANPYATHLLRSVVASTVLQYTSSALVNPWQVGKLLLQTQWVPRNAGEPIQDFEPEYPVSDSDSDDSYFADPLIAQTASRRPLPRPTDEQGYVVRHSVLEHATRPEYIVPVGAADTVWTMIRHLGSFRSEGWLALWKGLATSTLAEMLSTAMQPRINDVLLSLFFPSIPPFHQPPFSLPIASHVLTALILSPLDLIRTRLIVQSYNPRYRSYTGPLDALHKILRDEGGLKAIYFHSHLVIPAFLDSALRSAVSFALPGLIASYFGASHITEDSHPITWACVELTASCIGLLLTLPIETIRRRLQVQVRGTAQPIKACVELRPAPYNGVVDAFWHILTEERSDLPINHRPRRSTRSNKGKHQGNEQDTVDDEYSSPWKNTGLGQLYRGLGMQLSASAVYFLLNLLIRPEETDAGWVEI